MCKRCFNPFPLQGSGIQRVKNLNSTLNPSKPSWRNPLSCMDAVFHGHPSTVSPPSRGSQHLPGLRAYHQPDGKRHLAKDVGAVGGDRLHTSAPEDGVQPGLVHSVEIHTQVRRGVVPARRQMGRGVSLASIRPSAQRGELPHQLLC